jgi:catechol 2,3-dioxygenase-like lactoylglutathione lyase family enzyme
MILSLHHPSFTVENLERSVAFYRDVLGLTLEGIWSGTRPIPRGSPAFPGLI